MKKLIFALAIVLALPVVASAQKFGYVSFDTIMRDLPDVASAQKELEGVQQKYTREDSILKNELQLKYDEIQKLDQDPSTPDAIKDRRIQEIQQMTAKYQQFMEQAQQDLRRQQETLFAPIQLKIKNAINAVGDAGGYTLIFTNEVPAYVGATAVDVTPNVRKQLGL